MELSKKILSDVTVHMKYAKYIEQLQRREVWAELVDRNVDMHIKKFPALADEIRSAYQFVHEKKVLPSMRSMQFAGRPVELNPARMYNCSFLPMDDTQAFPEVMFLLLSGVGVGYSVQRHHIEKLPAIVKSKRTRRFVVGDSIEGWADAVKVLVNSYFYGKPVPTFDFSDIRPKGARLITSGGKAPGPEPLRDALHSIQRIFERKEHGEQLSSLDVHDICCFIADAVLAGGIRRSAMISLFDLDDEEMLTAKSKFVLPPVDDTITELNGMYQFYVEYQGERISVTLPAVGQNEDDITWSKYIQSGHKLPFFFVAPVRQRANNSAVIVRHKIDKQTFFDLWKTIEMSGSGEPGFFMTNDKEWGLNPCAEISLRPNQFCNLTTINAADIVDQADLNARAVAAAFIGTLQASYTDFHYLRDVWKKTTEREALIGVSMTGIAAGSALSLDLAPAAKLVKEENARVAKLIGINKAARTTTIKPEGTTSLVLGSSSGIHAWHNKFYIRTLRVNKKEPIYGYLMSKIPQLVEDEFFSPNTTAILKIPQRAPDDAILRDEPALHLLERVSKVWKDWVKPGHRKGENINNVSTTVSLKDHEWPEVGEWMWNNRDGYTALSVLPYDGHTYIQAPFQDSTEEEFNDLVQYLGEIDLSHVLEIDDNTTLADNLACTSGGCVI